MGLGLGTHRTDAAIGLVEELLHLHAAAVAEAAGKCGIVIIEEPAALEFDDRMMRRPTDYRAEDLALEGERPRRTGGSRIDEQVSVARGVGEVVDTLEFVNPGALEITACGIAGE